MNRILKKFIFIVVILTIIWGCSFLMLFPDSIFMDEKIKYSHEIDQLKSKKLSVFYNFRKGTESANSDFYLNEKPDNNDEVFFTFYSQLAKRPIPLQFLTFNLSTGYNGVNVEIYKIGNRFRTEVNNFTDNASDTNSTKYKILHTKLTLDKSDYKTGDSIFGKIKLEIEETGTDQSVRKYLSQGVFKSTVQ